MNILYFKKKQENVFYYKNRFFFKITSKTGLNFLFQLTDGFIRFHNERFDQLCFAEKNKKEKQSFGKNWVTESVIVNLFMYKKF